MKPAQPLRVPFAACSRSPISSGWPWDIPPTTTPTLPRHRTLLSLLLPSPSVSARYYTPTMSEHNYKFEVAMSCGGCSGAVERVLKKLDGANPPLTPLAPPASKSDNASRRQVVQRITRDADCRDHRGGLARLPDGAREDQEDGQDGQVGRGRRRAHGRLSPWGRGMRETEHFMNTICIYWVSSASV